MNKTGGSRALVVGIFFLLAGFGVFLIFYFYVRGEASKGEPDGGGTVPSNPDAGMSDGDDGEAALVEEPPLPAAGEPTDEQLRELAEALSGDEEFSRWVKNPALLGKFVAVVAMISRGESPRAMLEFMAPEGKFATIKRGEQEILDPQSYHRYDLVASAFSSLDAEKCAELVDRLTPWLNRKFREIKEPGQDFRATLAKAIAELLRVPMVTGDIPLEPKPVVLKFSDENLEVMSEAQKHLFRMGPDNILKIQAKLRQIGKALDLSGKLDGIRPMTIALPAANP